MRELHRRLLSLIIATRKFHCVHIFHFKEFKMHKLDCVIFTMKHLREHWLGRFKFSLLTRDEAKQIFGCVICALVAYYVLKCKWRFKLGRGSKWKFNQGSAQVRFRRRPQFTRQFSRFRATSKIRERSYKGDVVVAVSSTAIAGPKSRALPLTLHWIVTAIGLIAKRNYPELIEINRLIITSRTKLICFSVYLLADFRQAKCRQMRANYHQRGIEVSKLTDWNVFVSVPNADVKRK